MRPPLFFMTDSAVADLCAPMHTIQGSDDACSATPLQQDVPMSRIASVALLSIIAGHLAAQTPAPTYIVSRLGVDTVSIERYTRSSSKVEGDLVMKYPRVAVYHYVAELGPRGEVKSMTTVVRRLGGDQTAPPFMQATSTFGDSIAVIEVQRNGKADTASSGRKVFHGAVQPTLSTFPPAYGLYEQTLFAARPGRDSVVYALVGPGGGSVNAIILRKRGADSVAFTSTFFPNWTEVARVDSRGRIMGVDATATTIKTIATRTPDLDFDGVLGRWTAIATARGGARADMSPPDTVRATVGGAKVEVAYSRPLKRGRIIFGNVVPWNQVWRTGANAATQLTTDRDLVFGSTVVPAGKYTLWTLPTPTGAQLIVNSETGQWGTDYHADKDFARFDVRSTRLSQPVEQFVIGIVPQGNGGVLRFAWDDREYLVPFTVK